MALDQGAPARHESSMAKAHVAEAVHRVCDRAIQICGSLGVSGDSPLARYLTEIRPFRIYDGPTETHKWSIARRALLPASSVNVSSAYWTSLRRMYSARSACSASISAGYE